MTALRTAFDNTKSGDRLFDGIRSDVDDLAAADFAHMRHRLTRHAHGAHEAQIKGIVPIFVGKFHEFARRRAAGVIDDDVEPAEVRWRYR